MVSDASVAPDRLTMALRRFVPLLPLLVLLALVSRVIELASHWPVGLSAAQALQLGFSSAVTDLLAVLRFLPMLALLLLPGLRSDSPRVRIVTTVSVIALLMVAQGMLAQYRATAGVLLGADLFGYSWQEIRQTLGGARPDPFAWLSLAALLGFAAWRITRQQQRGQVAAPMRGLLPGLLLAIACSWVLGALGYTGPVGGSTEYLRTLRQNTLSSFIDDVLAKSLSRISPSRDPLPNTGSLLGFQPADPAYPFLHAETAPDVLGPLLKLSDRPPDIVVIIVEGLGRSFSGTGARLGSFTPFLDSLAAEGLYWENFLAPQGRTFGVLPALLGSMPFGEQGVLEMPSPLPAHANLPSLLKELGYQNRFFCGFDASFDNERVYLEQTGFERIIDRGRIATLHAIANEWGYDDDVLLQVAHGTPRDAAKPSFDVIQTISMHVPFTLPQQETWNARFEARLAELGIAGQRTAAYREHRDVYASVLFTDDALRRYFEAMRRDPARANTVFLVTGDHRLPEIPMEDRLERYHVPLLVWSPLLRQPRSIKAVSSQFDVLPSLAALFATRYGLKRPTNTTWLGSGLDLATTFRNLHQIPLKQTKTDLSDFVSGESFLGLGRSYRLRNGLVPDDGTDEATRDTLKTDFSRFLAANTDFGRRRSLQPVDAALTAAIVEPAARSTKLSISGLRVAAGTAHRPAVLHFELSNAANMPAVSAAPLAVVIDSEGRERGESYGQAVTLAARERIALQLAVDTSRLDPGQYFLALFPSDPSTGHRIGEGQFRVPLQVKR